MDNILSKKLEHFIGRDKMLYGDTDSIYLASESYGEKLIPEADRLGVQLKLERRWKILFLTSNKKQYFGITQEGRPIQKTLTGLKSDQPKYFQNVTQKLIDEFQGSFLYEYPIDCIKDYTKSVFEQLKNASLNELSFSKEAKKALYKYKNNGREREMYSEILEDCGGDVELAKSRSRGLEESFVEELKTEQPTCHDCSVTFGNGNIHHVGCDMERCPVCQRQFISCGHNFEARYFKGLGDSHGIFHLTYSHL